MTGTILTLLGTMVLVFIAALIFTNAIEWIASQLKLGCSFVGSIVAPSVYIDTGNGDFSGSYFCFCRWEPKDIGVGTIYGQPFMASSLSYGLVGLPFCWGFI